MKIINVTLHVKPELASDYQQFISQLVAGSRAEAGNLSYDSFLDAPLEIIRMDYSA